MTGDDGILPNVATRRIYFVVYPGFEILDLSGPSSVFSAANMITGRTIYQVEVVSADGGPITCAAGPILLSRAIAEVAPGPKDTLFVVGAEQEALDRVMADESLKNWLVATVPAVQRFGSFCLGSFVLANAGLLDERSAVTHWAACRQLSDDFPRVELEPESLYVKDRKVWTSAGVTTGIDMALAMIEEDLGRGTMGEVARRLVIYAHRPGNQTQRSPVLDTQVLAGETFPGLIAWLDAHLHEQIRVEDMAAWANMSERNFYRKFTDKIGMTPSKYLEGLRLERGKQYLEAGVPLKAVVQAVGFRAESAFRTAFQTRFDQSPSFFQSTNA